MRRSVPEQSVVLIQCLNLDSKKRGVKIPYIKERQTGRLPVLAFLCMDLSFPDQVAEEEEELFVTLF